MKDATFSRGAWARRWWIAVVVISFTPPTTKVQSLTDWQYHGKVWFVIPGNDIVKT